VYVSRLLEDALTGMKHPQTFYFICTLASKWPRLLVALTALFRWVRPTSNLHVEYLGSNFIGLETFGLGLALALVMASIMLLSNTSWEVWSIQ